MVNHEALGAGFQQWLQLNWADNQTAATHLAVLAVNLMLEAHGLDLDPLTLTWPAAGSVLPL